MLMARVGCEGAVCRDRHDATSCPPHHQTLLDGELVVDEDIETGQRTRRFLAYDMMMLNGTPLVQKPFKARIYSGIDCRSGTT